MDDGEIGIFVRQSQRYFCNMAHKAILLKSLGVDGHYSLKQGNLQPVPGFGNAPSHLTMYNGVHWAVGNVNRDTRQYNTDIMGSRVRLVTRPGAQCMTDRSTLAVFFSLDSYNWIMYTTIFIGHAGTAATYPSCVADKGRPGVLQCVFAHRPDNHVPGASNHDYSHISFTEIDLSLPHPMLEPMGKLRTN